MGDAVVADGGELQQHDGAAGVPRRQVLRPVGAGGVGERRDVRAGLLEAGEVATRRNQARPAGDGGDAHLLL